MFADDTCLFIEVDNRVECANYINEDLKYIHAWSQEWLVSFSPAKNKSLIISNKRDIEQNPALFLNN